MSTDRIVRLDINLPESLREEVERVAKTEKCSPSAFMQKAIERALLLKRHRALQKFGNLALKQGLTAPGVSVAVKESRAEASTRPR